MSATVRAEEGSVLFLLNSLTIGGSERKTVRLVNSLAAHQKRVVVAYLNGPHTLRANVDPGVAVHHLRRRGPFSAAACLRLRRLFRECRAHTVVCINLYPTIYALAARLAMGDRAPRVLVSINTTDFVSAREQRQMGLYRWLLRCTDGLIFGARVQRDAWYDRYGLRSDSRSDTVLYNGVDLEAFAPSPSGMHAEPTSTLTLGTVGKLRVEKSHGDFIQAVRVLLDRGLDVRGVIVGDGPERGALEGRIAALRLGDRVRIVGEVDDVRGHLARMDVFVLTSTKVETFSNATLEAMAMGVPVVSSDIGGMAEMLERGGGLLYRPGDIEGLCAHLATLLGDHERRRFLGRRGSEVVRERFGWQTMVDAFEAYALPAKSP
jgi:glycosyltransferase involved in cell wall biosynthesis